MSDAIRQAQRDHQRLEEAIDALTCSIGALPTILFSLDDEEGTEIDALLTALAARSTEIESWLKGLGHHE